MKPPRDQFAPRIYYFNPLLAGARSSWPQHLSRCEDMGFDHVLMAPIFAPGADGDIFLSADHDRANPAVENTLTVDQVVEDFARACCAHGLGLFLDVVIGEFARDAILAESSPSWFFAGSSYAAHVDPRQKLPSAHAAYPRFENAATARQIVEWWIARLSRLISAGATGFRCLAAQGVPPAVWQQIITGVERHFPACRFLVWTPGLDWHAVTRLRSAGFAAAFSSLPWWDRRGAWFAEEHQLLRQMGAVIACPEAPFGPRLARRLEDAVDLPAVYRHMLRCAAATGDGLMVPMGFECAASEDMSGRSAPSRANGGIHGGANIDLSAEVRDANVLNDRLAKLGVVGEMRFLNDPNGPVSVLMRSDTPDIREAHSAAVIMINSDLDRAYPVPVTLDPLPPTAGAGLSALEIISADQDSASSLASGEVRILRAGAKPPVKARRSDVRAVKLAAMPRIVIEHVVPSVDGGRFAAKRVIGEPVVVEADVFADGHEVLVATLLWRAADEREWRLAALHSVGNDRWQASILPDRIGRYEFTIEASVDKYASLCREAEIKHKAGADIAVEIAEGCRLLESAAKRAEDNEKTIIGSVLAWLTDASAESSISILLTPDLRELMSQVADRSFATRGVTSYPLEIERPQAAFGAWYELFPRSATDHPARHGTLADVMSRLPMLEDMGFDVLYLPPIHPIGRTNRKGKNNNLRAEPEDVGSPYAIGNSDGGHTAIHPALGGIDDFRRLRDAALEHGMELALDFAIQCSPDHPWLNEHPEWFSFRPDGSVRYAENPPKKYEDIVNVDFYAARAIPDLWNALRDVVLFWASEGVRIFRVDNPHTKPLPFWEWLIAQVRARHPEVIFLSESFTRPKMMYRLAKLGFSQSYTYFTWRNTKQEITDYFLELTTTEVKDFFRPHLFVNTPDINPYFLQTSGRSGFLIRAALAATLSGLWGIYSGFELCEAAPLPGREEYLNSEKYEIRVRRYDAPGNIIAEISRLNHIRKANSALQTHTGLRFYPAHNDQVLLYGKPLPTQRDIILVAVSLDPFHVQEATIEVPLWEWQLPDDGAVTVHDLMRDTKFVWTGKLQRIRLDAAELPFGIWRVAPRAGG
jgi:starch synthase (maltosyl-transferring)